MRLRTLPVSVAGVLAAWGCAVGDGCFRVLPGVLCLVFAVLCQVASNFANEYYDYRAGRDKVGREGPPRGVTEGDIRPETMKKAVFATLAVAALVGLSLTWWGGLWLIVAGAFIGFGALAYSTGPWPLSTHCMGEVAVFVFFGLVPVTLTYYVMSGEWAADVFMVASAIGLMGANVLIVNNYRDIPDDRSVGKHTLATEFGSGAMVVLYIVNASVAMILVCGVRYDMVPLVRWAQFFYYIASVAVAIRMLKRRGASLTPLLGITSVLMTLFALVFLIGQCL